MPVLPPPRLVGFPCATFGTIAPPWRCSLTRCLEEGLARRSAPAGWSSAGGVIDPGQPALEFIGHGFGQVQGAAQGGTEALPPRRRTSDLGLAVAKMF